MTANASARNLFAFALVAVFTLGVHAEEPPFDPTAAFSSLPHGNSLNAATVREVEPDVPSVTLEHEPLPQLAMPAMTMSFHISNPAALRAVQPGDSVHFRAENVHGLWLVSEIKPAR